jgi:hypothetical protein
MRCRETLALDLRFAGWTAAWTAVALVAFGVVSAIIPNPVFGRQVPPEPFAIWVWLISAPLMGIVGATYTAPVRSGAPTIAGPLGVPGASGAAAIPVGRDGSTLGAIGSFGAFLAIGCPVCNKVALVLLGASGAMSVYAPLQPLIGAASLALLAGTIAWRMRLRARGGACPV